MVDMIIRGGTVYDGAGGPGYKADVAVKGGIITQVGDLSGLTAQKEIDAAGRAVTPGFIDMHSHADCSVAMWPDMESALGQGITTCFAGHCGMGVAPVKNYWLEQCFEARAFNKVIPQIPGGPIPGDGRVLETSKLRQAFFEAYGQELDWSSFGEFVQHLGCVGHGANMAINVGHSQLRQQFMGHDARRAATGDEIAQMVRELERSLDEGAFGLSFGFDYVSSMYAKEDELTALMDVCARRGAVVTAHMQTGPERRGKVNENFTLYDGFVEFLDLGLKTDAKIHISHIYTIETPGTGDPVAEARQAVDKILELIASYRTKGVEVTWDYLGQNPAACFFFPQLSGKFLPYVAECGGKQAFIKALNNPWYRDYVAQEIRSGGHRATSPFSALGRRAGKSWASNLVITGCSNRSFIGRSIGQISEELGMDCVDTAIEIVRQDPETMCDRQRETDPPSGHFYVLDEDMSFGTDNGAHDYGFIDQDGPDMPYVCGTPTEFVGMVEYFNTFRELPFEAMIKRMTGNGARAMGISDRGFIKPSMAADLLVIDRENLRSNLDLARPQTAPDGLDYVIVNGQVAVDHKRHLHPRAGFVIRRP